MASSLNSCNAAPDGANEPEEVPVRIINWNDVAIHGEMKKLAEADEVNFP
ncbi:MULTISPECIES: hypothetical protein [unclassified Neorhizobium]|nr:MULTISPECIES: hypothetical protein [unclassified Neorhizobium]MCJ9748043.1 hypothetical protein [Neorhizobium sp. SHOUNA12A]